MAWPACSPNNPIFNVICGGQFVIEWLADDDWLEGTGTPSSPTTDGVCYESLPDLLAQRRETLATNTYTPPGNNVPVFWPLPLTANLWNNVTNGADLNLRFYAADNQVSYLFNSYKYGRGNQPLILVVASPLLVLESGTFTNNAFQLTGIGGDNGVYNVQESTNLAVNNWVTIATVTASTNGAITYDDTDTLVPQRYYRLSQ